MTMELAEFRWVLHALSWLIVAVIAICVLWFANAVLGSNIRLIMSVLLEEIRQVVRRKPGVGTANMFGLLIVALFGLITLVADGLGAVHRAVLAALGTPAATSIQGQVDPGLYFLAVLCFAVFSVFVMGRSR